MEHSVCLNISYDAPGEIWDAIGEVYRSMEYWTGNDADGCPSWKGEGISLNASVEPGGIQISGEMPEQIWDTWYTALKAELTARLGYAIGEPEDGYRFKHWTPFRKQYSEIKSIDKQQIAFLDGSVFAWNLFEERERDITARPPYFTFRSPLIELIISVERTGFLAARKQKEDFRELQTRLNDLGITTLDLS